MSIDYKLWYANAKAELESLRARKEQAQQQLAVVERSISALAKTLDALAPLAGEQPEPALAVMLLHAGATVLEELGLTTAIRAVLVNAKGELSPMEIRGQLQAGGFNLGNYANAMSTIHTVLKRLVDSGESREVTTPEGKKYCWVRGAKK